LVQLLQISIYIDRIYKNKAAALSPLTNLRLATSHFFQALRKCGSLPVLWQQSFNCKIITVHFVLLIIVQAVQKLITLKGIYISSEQASF
jgi:hypothetical protein